MAQSGASEEPTPGRETLAALVRRIKARQVRQVMLWRRPMQPACSSAAPHGAQAPLHPTTDIVRPAAHGRDRTGRNGS